MRDKHLGYWFVAPATLTLVAVLVFPAVVTVLYSFTAERAPLLSQLTLRNYRLVAADPAVLASFINTLLFVVCSVGFHLVMGMWVALLLHEIVKGSMVFQTIMLLPWTIPDVVAGIIWKWMLHPVNGIVNDLLFHAGLIETPVEWLSRPALAFPSVIAANIWRGFPFVMLILLAGLKSIPIEQYEAAAVDGATALQRFRYITLPGLRKLVVIALALDTVWEFRRFGLVAAMTNGGPGYSTEILSLTVFKQYFEFFRFEFASAVAIVMSLVLLIASVPYVMMMVREEQ
jgi:multiple sugar transport system permease protein